jgi:large subunit ribosomal protein L15
MNINELKPTAGSRKRRKIVGRGKGSGHGKTSCRGHNGQNSRSGGGTRPGFEGGQMPLARRTPKRGFNVQHSLIYQLVNLKSLTRFKEASIITPDILLEKGLIKNKFSLIKILGDGEINKPLTIKAHSFSQSAAEKIKKAGGTAELITEKIKADSQKDV